MFAGNKLEELIGTVCKTAQMSEADLTKGFVVSPDGALLGVAVNSERVVCIRKVLTSISRALDPAKALSPSKNDCCHAMRPSPIDGLKR